MASTPLEDVRGRLNYRPKRGDEIADTSFRGRIDILLHQIEKEDVEQVTGLDYENVSDLLQEEVGVALPTELAVMLGMNKLLWEFFIAHTPQNPTVLFLGHNHAADPNKPANIQHAEATVYYEPLRYNRDGTMIVPDIRLAGITDLHRRVVAARYNTFSNLDLTGFDVSVADEEFPLPKRDIYYPINEQAYYDVTQAIPTDLDWPGRTRGLITGRMVYLTGGDVIHHRAIQSYDSTGTGDNLRLNDPEGYSSSQGFHLLSTPQSHTLSFDPSKRSDYPAAKLPGWSIALPKSLVPVR